MAKDHYIPAAFLGGFSHQSSGRRRNRELFVASRDDPAVSTRRASDIAWQEDMYSLADLDDLDDDLRDDVDDVEGRADRGEAEPLEVGSDAFFETVDIHWQDYEQLIPEALERLAGMGPWATYPAELWLRVLVPFVAGLLVRGPDFHERHSSRIPDEDLFRRLGTSNGARVTEMTRLLAPLIAAEWTYITFEDDARLITSDRGFAWTTSPWGETGIAIPVSPTAAVVILPQQERVVLRSADSGWLAQFRVLRQTWFDAHALNEAVAGAAFTLIAGNDRPLVDKYVSKLSATTATYREPYSPAWPPSRVRRLHEMEWHRLVALASSQPTDGQSIRVHFHEFANDVYHRGRWAPPPLLAVNYPAYGTGLIRIDGVVRLRLLSSEQGNMVHQEAVACTPGESVTWWS